MVAQHHAIFDQGCQAFFRDSWPLGFMGWFGTDVEPSSRDVFSPRSLGIWYDPIWLIYVWNGLGNFPTKYRQLLIHQPKCGGFFLPVTTIYVKFRRGDDSLLTKWILGNQSPKSKTNILGGSSCYPPGKDHISRIIIFKSALVRDMWSFPELWAFIWGYICLWGQTVHVIFVGGSKDGKVG